jgi:glycosyltransferase involved in cell wall biosynthesis
MRHKRRSCSPAHTSEDCYACTRKDIGRDIARTTWERGFVGVDRKDCLSQRKWCSAFGFEALDDDAAPDKIIDFAKTCTEKINENCDTILAVSQRVYDIAAGEGFDKNKMVVSYIGTRVALEQTDRANAVPDDGLKIVFLGNDINYEEKGYPWFLESLEQVPAEYAAKIDLFLTVNVQEHAEIYEMCSNFRSITVKVKYTRDELKHILKGCHLGIVPVLWEDNLPQIAIEMVAYGVPVLTSSAGGAKELCDSELFVFEGGNTEDFISKLMHFVDVPEDLRAYWQHHHGLVTMKQHWNELKKYYKADMSEITLSSQDYYHLMLEHDFLVKNMSIREERFTPQFIVDDLRNKLYEAEEENHRLREEKSDMEKINGHITFHTDYNAYMGHVGADLFKITLKKFDFSNFYAEIRFNKLLNVDKAYSNIMRVSGTWLKKDDEYVLQLHQLDWVFDEPQISDWVFCYIRENSLCFFARYPGKSCSIAYDVLTLSTRADIKSATVEKLYEKTFISENELRPEDVFNTFAEYTALKTLKDAVTVGAEIKQEKAAEITSVATAANGDTAEQKMGRLASNENAL